MEIKKKKQNKIFPTYLNTEFDNWANGKLEKTTIRNYQSWMNQLPNYIHEENFQNNIKRKITKIKFFDNYLELINAFVKVGDRLYALSVYDKIYEIVKLAKIYCSDDKKDDWGNRHAAFVALGNFLNEHDYSKHEEVKDIAEMRYNIPRNALRKQDGMDALLSILKVEEFVKMAVTGSYFFSKKLVSSQIEKGFLNKARHTTDKIINHDKKGKGAEATYFIDGNTYNVAIDKTNNRYVCDLINDKTFLNLGHGKNSIIQNTIISHVWGRAFDPRFFTSLWNIVLIPAWANSLMDKEDAVEDSLASKMRATYMAICKKWYDDTFSDNQFTNKFEIDVPEIKNEKDIIHQEYKFNVINEKINNTIDITIEKIKL